MRDDYDDEFGGRFMRRIPEGYVHWCPGCAPIAGRSPLHAISVDTPNAMTGARWTFDGNLDAPTFSPSINCVGQCHYFIVGGRISYCADSAHALAGQTVPMVPIGADWEPVT